MIRIDEIYDNLFSPLISSKPRQSMHYFHPFGRTDIDALCVSPLIINRDTMFLFWDQEPYLPKIHNETINWLVETFIHKTHTNLIFVTSEKHSTHVDNLCSTHGFINTYYFFHAWASLDWFRGYNRAHLIPNYKDREITNTFTCPNRIVSGGRVHRIELFTKIVNKNLIGGNKISFPLYCPSSDDIINIPNVELPLVFDNEEPGSIPNESYKISLWDTAKNSLTFVVTETLYHEETLHLTEKIFKPIVMQMPFLIVGPKFSLRYLRDYGFKTFNDFWSEDYDTQNNDTRIESVVQILSDLDNMTLCEKKKLQKHIAPIVEHNFKWFYSKEFEELLWRELSSMTEGW